MFLDFSQYFGGVSFIGINISEIVDKSSLTPEANLDVGIRSIYSTRLWLFEFQSHRDFFIIRFGRKKTRWPFPFCFSFLSFNYLRFETLRSAAFRSFLFAFGQSIGFKMISFSFQKFCSNTPLISLITFLSSPCFLQFFSKK